MKKIVPLFVAMIFVASFCKAQVINPKEKAKQKVEDRTNQNVDKGIDKTLDKVEKGLGNIFKKKDKKKKNNSSTTTEPDTIPQNTNSPSTDSEATDFTKYKTYDFVPGSKTIFFEDFASGQFTGWKSSGDNRIEQHDGKNWLVATGGGFYPLNLAILPKNFTLEMEIMVKTEKEAFPGTFDIRFLDKSQKDVLEDPYLENFTQISLSAATQLPKEGSVRIYNEVNNEEKLFNGENELFFKHWHRDGNRKAKFAMVRQQNMLSLYLDEVKLYDNLNAFAPVHELLLAFHFQTYFVDNAQFLITNIRLATDIPNAKNDFEKEGRFVTNSIYFDINSSRIKPESYTILKEAAKAINGTTGIISIIGHTDSDGDDTANLILSQKRAVSVKNALVKEFGVNADRLQTDGKGEAQPVEANTTAAGKAKNRRVEFIKL